MLTRLAGLAALIPAAAIGLTAQVVVVPWTYGLDLTRRASERHWDWDTAPVLPVDPSYRHHQAGAA